jgi:hypothetical protein
MKWTTGGAIVLSVLMATTANDISAQDADAVGRRGGRGAHQGVEMIMSMREGLELTDDQLASLEEMRRDAVQVRYAHGAELAEMRSQLEAGQIRQSDMMAFMEDRRDGAGDVSGEHQQRIEGILTEAQLETLQNSHTQRGSMSRGRRGARGPSGVRRGSGMGGQLNRGMRGGAGWQGRADFRRGRMLGRRGRG